MMLNTLAMIRELIWPLLEKETIDDTPDATVAVTPENFLIDDSNLELAFQLQSKIYESEEDRRKTTETKASLFIGSLSISTTIIIATNGFIWGKDIPYVVIQTSVIISFILTIYTLRTVWFSVKALERRYYDEMGDDEINFPGDRNNYLRHLILTLSRMIACNEKIINKKVSNLVMAQEYYKRAIFVICLYALSLLVYMLFFRQSQPINVINLGIHKCLQSLKL